MVRVKLHMVGRQGEPFLALPACTSFDIGRWRLRVFSTGGKTVYEEILARPGTLLVGPGRQVLLLAGG